jgi:hypothetical protein
VDYEQAVKHYVELRAKNREIEKEAEAKIAENKEKMEQLGTFIKLKAEKDGLETVKTKSGTVFWTIGARCTTSNADEFMTFCIKNELWELLEKRPSKTGVRDYVNSHKVVPPGVDYVTVSQINVRTK